MSSSEGDSKPALGEGPKVFMLALAKLFIRIRSFSESWPGVASAQARNYIFTTIIWVKIISNHY